MSIYLDHNSTTPVLPEVAAAMAECFAAGYANPASQHQAGRRARQVLEQAREDIGGTIGADFSSRTPDRVIFTSGGTEANNLALLGIAGAATGQTKAPHEAIISAIEHPSILGPAEALKRRGWIVHRLAVTSDGIARVEQLAQLLNERTRLVSVMLANNETGVVQPVRELAAICNAAGVPLHTDAAQVVGKLPVDFRDLGAAAMTIAAHKFGGPLGIGALILRHDVTIEPQFHGGFQQAGMRPGTESVALAVGMRVALAAFESGPLGVHEGESGRGGDEAGGKLTRPMSSPHPLTSSSTHSVLATLRDRFETGLRAGYPDLVINGLHAKRLPGTSNVAFLGLDRQQLLIALDLAGIACSTGSACASGSSEPSPVLRAMGLPSNVVASSLRFSLGATTTASEIDEAVERILEVSVRLLRSTAGKVG